VLALGGAVVAEYEHLRQDHQTLAAWSGQAFWENTAGRVMVKLLRTNETVSREAVLLALRRELQRPDQDYRTPAIVEAISRIEELE
jgi:hypothetical protein